LNIQHHKGDLPEGLDLGTSVAVDTETQGLNPIRDRLCLLQISSGDGVAHLVQFADRQYEAPNLKAVLADRGVLKIFHFARFDLAVIQRYLGVMCQPVYCTKIASRLVRTYTDRHGLKDLCQDLLSVELSKKQQTTDWAAPELSEEQLKYAASDVAHLHALKAALDARLQRDGRGALAQACFDFLPARAVLDLAGWAEMDIFEH
jgi:ribonuclease D